MRGPGVRDQVRVPGPDPGPAGERVVVGKSSSCRL